MHTGKRVFIGGSHPSFNRVASSQNAKEYYIWWNTTQHTPLFDYLFCLLRLRRLRHTWVGVWGTSGEAVRKPRQTRGKGILIRELNEDSKRRGNHGAMVMKCVHVRYWTLDHTVVYYGGRNRWIGWGIPTGNFLSGSTAYTHSRPRPHLTTHTAPKGPYNSRFWILT